MPAAFFIAARSAVDSGLGTASVGDSTGVLGSVSAGDPPQPASTMTSTASAASRT